MATGLNARIRERYTAVQELVAQGYSIRAVMRELGLARGIVRRYARPANVEELLTSAARPSNLDDFKPYLYERFAAGTTRPIHLFAEIQAQGYTGSYPNVRDYVRRLRRWHKDIRRPLHLPPFTMWSDGSPDTRPTWRRITPADSRRSLTAALSWLNSPRTSARSPS